MRYGFVVDNRKCIGCHACTVACKSEHHVPLGVNRTWVKYVEKGRFPATRRFFQVTRCNHCANPPCVGICPVGAMFRRGDGIVDFDSSRCIGCKACMQACPYDAIYLDPERKTAAKCNYCAHRTSAGFEPSCVVTCPEHAIVAGDLDDPTSEAAQLLGREEVKVRKPEQGTQPGVFYIDADECTLSPTLARHEPFFMWAERNKTVPGGGAHRLPPAEPLPVPVLAAYDVEHERPWAWPVPVYFWAKSIGAGALWIPALAVAFGATWLGAKLGALLALVALAFMALTVVMLVGDLARSERFLNVVLKPQGRSWLARGAWFLILYSALAAAYGAAQYWGCPAGARWLLVPTALGGVPAAIYTAFLFGQCEGCDLWQTPLLPLHLLVQGALSSGAVLSFVALGEGGAALRAVAVPALGAGLVLHALLLLGEIGMRHTTDNARYATRLIVEGPYRAMFWLGALGLGIVFPAVLLVVGAASGPAIAVAGAAVLAGLLAWEWCFVMAGQGVPNS
jgi:Fe-S-cluster-containing dehydrogenase component/formate-dependent nitrite reductase membrane component NrfD